MKNMTATSSVLVLLCLFFPYNVVAYSLLQRFLSKSNVILYAKKALTTSASSPDTSIGQKTVVEAKKKASRKPVTSKNPRDWTPYNFKDQHGEYDVPFINEPMW